MDDGWKEGKERGDTILGRGKVGTGEVGTSSLISWGGG